MGLTKPISLVNNLLHTVPGKALDAVQGKVLGDMVQGLSDNVDGLLTGGGITARYNPDTGYIEVLNGEEWVNGVYTGLLAMRLYYYGDNSIGQFAKHSAYTVGGETYPTGPTFETDGIVTVSPSDTKGHAVGIRSVGIDMTDYKKLTLEYSVECKGWKNNHSYLHFTVCNGTSKMGAWNSIRDYVSSKTHDADSATAVKRAKLEIDVSTLTGIYYVSVVFSGGYTEGTTTYEVHSIIAE